MEIDHVIVFHKWFALLLLYDDATYYLYSWGGFDETRAVGMGGGGSR